MKKIIFVLTCTFSLCLTMEPGQKQKKREEVKHVAVRFTSEKAKQEALKHLAEQREKEMPKANEQKQKD